MVNSPLKHCYGSETAAAVLCAFDLLAQRAARIGETIDRPGPLATRQTGYKLPPSDQFRDSTKIGPKPLRQ
jgi:hypothetical protein